MSRSERPRVAVLGARRVRQGLGPFVARDLVRAGCDVPAFLCRRAESLEPAAEALRAVAGVDARGYAGLDALLAAERLDAVAILAPAVAHGALLEAARGAGLAVLCEKPLVWGGDDPAAEAAAHVAGFERAGLLLMENCQWPETLPAFERLHPGALDAPPRRFAMRLSPVTVDARGLVDSLSHPLSLLQALAPDPAAELADVEYGPLPGRAGALRLAFRLRGPGCDVAAEVELVPGAGPPREAAYAVDGRRAERTIDPDDYSMRFADGDRAVDVPDPLGLRVARFAAALETSRDLGQTRPDAPPRPGGLTPGREIVQRMELLCALVRAYDGRSAAPDGPRDPRTA